MKVLLLNGSSKPLGCTYRALDEVANTLNAQHIETEIFSLGSGPYWDCTACGVCSKTGGGCVFDKDKVNTMIEKAKTADGFVFGSPVYFAHPSGRILSAMDRLFTAGRSAFTQKPAAAISSARRAGTTDTMDVFNKYFTIAQMPIVSSTYWNGVHGTTPDEVVLDLEGLQIMRNLGANMAWLLKCIALGKEHNIHPPTAERTHRTNFLGNSSPSFK